MQKNKILLVISIIIFMFALIFFLTTINSNDKTANNYINQSNKSLIADTSNTVYDTASTNNTTLDESEYDILSNLDYEKLPDIKFFDQNQKEIKISDLDKKPFIILFSDFSNNSDDSSNLLDTMNYYYSKYKEKINFICIDTKNIEIDSDIKTFKDSNGIELCNITNLPSILFINKNLEIINKKESVTLDSFEANIDLILENY